MRINLPVTGRAIEVRPEANILTTTDLASKITYVNPDFIEISGFSEDELVGSNHHIVRHPDMPPEAFADMWASLRAGRSWMGLVKNRCKNGDHYWISAYATPVVRNGQVVEYQSVRSRPAPGLVENAEQLYAKIRAGKTPRGIKPSRLSFAQRSSLILAAPAVAVGGMLGVTGIVPLIPALIGGLGFAVVLAVTQQWLLRPLAEMTRRAKAIADNPLGQFVYTGRNDEFGSIAFAMLCQDAEAGAVVGRIADSSRQLSSSASELAQAIDSSAAASLQQQNETDMVATAIEEMAATALEVSRHAQESATAAGDADSEATSGLRLMEDNRRTIASLATEVEQSNQVIHQLDQHSQEINRVLEVIQSIAEQTNLLALNAAIEAARAGEAGRGFAVVADEVRGLASRTQRSTAEIHSIISILQQGTSDAVVAMQRSQHKAEASVEQALQAARALEEINRRVSLISEMNVQIATAAEEQSAVSEDIQRNLCGIREATDSNVSAGTQSRSNAAQVSSLAGQLQLLAEQFWSRSRRA